MSSPPARIDSTAPDAQDGESSDLLGRLETVSKELMVQAVVRRTLEPSIEKAIHLERRIRASAMNIDGSTERRSMYESLLESLEHAVKQLKLLKPSQSEQLSAIRRDLLKLKAQVMIIEVGDTRSIGSE